MSLKTRTITGLSFGAVVITACLFSQVSSAILLCLVSGLCVYEFSHLLIKDNGLPHHHLIYLFFLPIGYFAYKIQWIPDLICIQGVFALLYILFVVELFSKRAKPFYILAISALSVFYIVIPFIFGIDMIYCTHVEINKAGNIFVLCIIFMVWASDVFAYLLGSLIGKHKMFERISPKKTWEGTISGVIGANIVGILCSKYLPHFNFELTFWISLATLCSVVGILGDLIESMLKRSLNIKDSGTILPGHGGFLDRFDALIFVLPFSWLYVEVYFYLF